MKKIILGLLILPFFASAQTSLVSAPTVTSATHPDQSAWYTANHLELSWDRPNGAYGFSFILNQKPDTIPDDILDTTITHKSYDNLKDGTWYFHIKGRRRTEEVYGQTAHFAIHIDSKYSAPIVVPSQPQSPAVAQTNSDIKSGKLSDLINRPVAFPLYIFMVGAFVLLLILLLALRGLKRRLSTTRKVSPAVREPEISYQAADTEAVPVPVKKIRSRKISPPKKTVRKPKAKVVEE